MNAVNISNKVYKFRYMNIIMGKLLMFYGTECVHCHEMFPLIEKLEKEEGMKVEKLEIWHNSKNKQIYDKCNNTIKCTGVPYLYNENSGKGICGTIDYQGLKKWVKGK